MEARSMHFSSRCKKFEEDGSAAAAADRISALHDMVLHHILSFLPTTDAVRTCILSKRFDSMWTSLPNLHFENTSDVKRDLFMNFVERVLTHRDSSSLQTVTLKCAVHSDAMRIHTWISAFIRRKVKVLSLCLSKIKEPFGLPLCLFNSNSLEELDLYMSHVLALPTSICFSSLKKLTLQIVIFPNDHLTQQFFSGCPVLEELDLLECNLVNLSAVSISSSRLKRFTISESENPEDNECEIEILSTCLEYFYCQGELRNDYFLSSASSVVHTCLYVMRDGQPEGVPEVAYRLNRLLKFLPNTTKLHLSSWAFQVFRFEKELSMHIPIFKSLTHLEFHLGAVWLDFDFDGLLKILQNSPHLESLYFADGVRLEISNPERDDQIFSPVPSCFTSHLKTIKVRYFTGGADEIAAVKILLANSAVLKTMEISYHLATDSVRRSVMRQEVHKRLLFLPRSSTCSIVLL